MPAGLDGNPDPVRSSGCDAVIQAVVDRIALCGSGRICVGVDGRSGVGESTFADELAAGLVAAHVGVLLVADRRG